MKKLFLALLIFPQALFAQKLEKYVDLIASTKLVSGTLSLSVSYGDDTTLFKPTWSQIDEDRINHYTNTMDAVNYMGTQDWKLINTFVVIGTLNTNVHYVFKKEYDASEVTVRRKK